MDVIDRANDYAERMTADAIARQAAGVTRHRQGLFDPETGERVCVDCYEPIPEKRIAARPDAIRCVECEGFHERRRA